jgi:diaminohydroxyphosphoribosylaminopyrimidine deaminase/5-amino-6-(5-phosphoribosylamino)uracil reductase
VVVGQDGVVVGEGATQPIGGPHAEAVALAAAGARARGATLYVTLEPCAHTGRTPPCTDAIVAAGIRRCVVAMRDPNPIVNGRGFARLARAGVRIERGLMAAECAELVGGYVLAHTAARPRVTWKVAASLDGRVADGRGRSRWITGAAARAHGHRLRAHADAVLIGAGTARADDPRLTVRGVRGAHTPLRVVCDTRLRLPLTLRLFGALARGTVVACGRSAGRARERALRARGVTVWRLAESHGRVSPRALARALVRAGCHEVLLEGGPTLGTAWLAARLVDRLALFQAPIVLGAGPSWCGDFGAHLASAPRGRALARSTAGDDGVTLFEFEGGR